MRPARARSSRTCRVLTFDNWRNVATHTVGVAVLLASAVRPSGAQDDSARTALFRSIQWAQGPITGQLGTVAQVGVPAGCTFSTAVGAKAFMEATQNPPTGREQGVVLCGSRADSTSQTWFVVFEFDETGYIKDEEKAQLDSNKIYASIDEGTRQANKARRARGWTDLTMGGWVRPPYYDERTHNLTWALRVFSVRDTSINHSVRLLGRNGVIKAELVINPEGFTAAMPAFESIIGSTAFLPGNTYGEWREGDKVAAYGLTALIAGGAGAAAMKLGLFGKLWKLIAAFFVASAKLLIAAAVGLLAWIRNLFRRRPSSTESGPPAGGA